MIHLVVALPAEARPLIGHFKLNNKHADSTFPIYLGADMTLVVSGPGKAAAAAATAWLQGLTHENKNNAWLNIGIAGHANFAIGDGRIANRITESATNRSWYPPQIHDLKIATSRLMTVDIPENDYTVDTLYDMEATGYYPTACRFTTSELVQCFKVVSDNRDNASERITAKHCEQLIDSQLEPINQLVKMLGNIQTQYSAWHAPHPDLDRLSQHWHFTVSQQHQLEKLLKRWTVLTPGETVWNRELEKNSTAADVLHSLTQQLNTYS